MKKRISIILFVLLFISMVGCSEVPDNNDPQGETPSVPNNITPSVPNTTQNNTDVPSALPPSEEPSQLEEDIVENPVTQAQPEKDIVAEPVIQVSDGKNVITFQLNDSKAAKDLYDQLPLSLEVEDYSNNEKIFYPPKVLDVNDTPKAGGQVGTLAYYAPWADVVMFFGSYSPNGSLYELGQAVSGSEHIQNLTGTIEITKE